MNSQRTESDKKKAASTLWTKETLGVVLILFATLCLICLISRDGLFSDPGLYVNDFLMGLFGYFAFPLTLWTIAEGVFLIVGKRPALSFKRKALIACAVLSVAAFSHILSMGNGYSSYGAYLSASYSLGVNAYSAGGIVTALFSYFLQSLLSVVGSAVVLGAVFAVSVFFLVKDIIRPTSAAADGRGFKSSFVKNRTAVEEDAEAISVAKESVSNQEAVSFADTPAADKSGQKLFVGTGQDFAFKTRREMSKESGSAFKIDSSLNVLNVTSVNGSYSEAYNSEMQKKIEYIKTPAKIEVDDKYSPVKNSEPKISDYISARDDIKDEAENVTAAEEVIPMIEHDDVSEGVRFRAAEFDEKYVNQDFDTPKAEEPETEETATEEDIAEAFDAASAHEEETRPTDNGDLQAIDGAADVGGISRVREGRARRIFFGEESDRAFSSRVEKDDNVIQEYDDADVFKGREETVRTEDAREEIKPAPPINREYFRPPLDLLETYTPPSDAPKEDHEERVEIIRKVLEDFHISVEPQGFVQGPTITRYEVKMPAGITVKKVLAYDDDLKMRLQSKAGVRIEAPIPGKDLVGIEVANRTKVTVGLKEVLEGAAGKKEKSGALTFALGKDIVGNSIVDNLAKGPHYLVAGATGSGKSVCLNVMIVSMIMRYSPEELRLILIDPKRVGFRKYEHLPHLMIDEIVTEPQKAVAVLAWAYNEMERRYDEFAKIEGGLVSDIESYNELVASDTVAKMPRIVIVVDELADLMETCKKDMELQIRLLAQKARAAGIHLVLATQRPSVDVVTGTIKANLPSRIALKVMNFADSSTILSEGGAEKLLGNGDMLYKNSGMPEPERYQGAWISDREISNVVNYIKEKNVAYYDDGLKEYLDRVNKPRQEETAAAESEEDADSLDEFFLKALWLAVTSNSVSISQLQRRFQIGYARAGGLVDKMERLGFVSGNEGSKARRVLITREEFESRFGSFPDNY